MRLVAGAVRASLVTYIIPISGLLLSWIVLGEGIEVSTMFGSAVILAGVAAAMYGPAIAATSVKTGLSVPRTGKYHEKPTPGRPASGIA